MLDLCKHQVAEKDEITMEEVVANVSVEIDDSVALAEACHLLQRMTSLSDEDALLCHLADLHDSHGRAADAVPWGTWMIFLVAARLRFIDRRAKEVRQQLMEKHLPQAKIAMAVARSATQLIRIIEHPVFQGRSLPSENPKVIALLACEVLLAVVCEALSTPVVVWSLSVLGQSPEGAPKATPSDVPHSEAIKAARELQTR